jgi:hypothetical protein
LTHAFDPLDVRALMKAGNPAATMPMHMAVMAMIVFLDSLGIALLKRVKMLYPQQRIQRVLCQF